MKKRKIIRPTPEENERINAGIALDPDNPEWSDEDFARAKPADPKMMELTNRYRGKQKKPIKVAISIRLDKDIVDSYKASGKGWQGRVNEALRGAMLHGKDP